MTRALSGRTKRSGRQEPAWKQPSDSPRRMVSWNFPDRYSVQTLTTGGKKFWCRPSMVPSRGVIILRTTSSVVLVNYMVEAIINCALKSTLPKQLKFNFSHYSCFHR